MKITVLYSLPSYLMDFGNFRQADDDTAFSAHEVNDALISCGYETDLMPIHIDEIFKVKGIKSDLVFNLIEWTGKDLKYSVNTLQILESMGIPFTGVGSKVFESTSDKSLMKKVLMDIKAPTPKYRIYRSTEDINTDDFSYPQFIKLVCEHCSIGLTSDCVVYNRDQKVKKIKQMLTEFSQPVMSEEYIEGREFQVTVYDSAHGPVMLPPSEIVFRGYGYVPFLTFDSRWNEKHADYDNSTVRIADLSKDLYINLENIVLDVFKNFPLTDYARFDMRLRDNDFYILEANSNPGLGDDDEYGMTVSQRASGMTFSDFRGLIVKSCQNRFQKSSK